MYFVDFHFCFWYFRKKMTAKFQFHLNRFEILKFQTWRCPKLKKSISHFTNLCQWHDPNPKVKGAPIQIKSVSNDKHYSLFCNFISEEEKSFIKLTTDEAYYPTNFYLAMSLNKLECFHLGNYCRLL
jgi:hypothetical protein